MENFLSLNGCLAIKQGDLAKAGECIKQAATMKDEVFIQALKDIMVMAIRRHKYEVLADWLQVVDARLKKVMANPEMFAESQGFLESFLFALCDHRLTDLKEAAKSYIEIFQGSVSDIVKLKPFYLELTSLSCRMAARKWDDEAIWLLDLAMDKPVKECNLPLLEEIFFQINMHAVMHSKTFDFSHMLYIYKAEQYAYMTLISSCEALAANEATGRLALCLRNLRNLMSNVARITMKDEMEIYQSWYDHMLYFYGKDEKLKSLSILMIQLTINYWKATQPKSSRKQIRYLDKVLNPSYINDPYQKLLEQII